MSVTRAIIDDSTRFLSYLKRGRKVAPSAMPVKINLGCGLAVCEGWINVDGSLNALIASWPSCFRKLAYRLSGASAYYSRDTYMTLLETHDFVHHDLSYGIPFSDGCADFVYSSHFFEHMDKHHASLLLDEAYRVLRTGGVIRLAVPDLAFAVDLYRKGDKERMLDDYFFVDHRESSFARHKYMYDFDLLRSRLRITGFEDIVRCSFREGATPDLAILDNRPDDTLFVEATKRR